MFKLTTKDLSGFDTVVDTLFFFTLETLILHSTSLNHLTDLLKNTKTRLLVVGDAGSLYMEIKAIVFN